MSTEAHAILGRSDLLASGLVALGGSDHQVVQLPAGGARWGGAEFKLEADRGSELVAHLLHATSKETLLRLGGADGAQGVMRWGASADAQAADLGSGEPNASKSVEAGDPAGEPPKEFLAYVHFVRADLESIRSAEWRLLCRPLTDTP